MDAWAMLEIATDIATGRGDQSYHKKLAWPRKHESSYRRNETHIYPL